MLRGQSRFIVSRSLTERETINRNRKVVSAPVRDRRLTLIPPPAAGLDARPSGGGRRAREPSGGVIFRRGDGQAPQGQWQCASGAAPCVLAWPTCGESLGSCLR